jgi:hypothetical protein
MTSATTPDEPFPEQCFGPDYIGFLKRELKRIGDRHCSAQNDDDRWLADFQYIDCLNEMTRAKVAYASSTIDDLENYELVMVRNFINLAIRKDDFLQERGVS